MRRGIYVRYSFHFSMIAVVLAGLVLSSAGYYFALVWTGLAFAFFQVSAVFKPTMPITFLSVYFLHHVNIHASHFLICLNIIRVITIMHAMAHLFPE